jgi:hypothetical protein
MHERVLESVETNCLWDSLPLTSKSSFKLALAYIHGVMARHVTMPVTAWSTCLSASILIHTRKHLLPWTLGSLV